MLVAVPQSGTDPVSVDDLPARMAAGDREALAALYDQTKGRVFGLALRVVGDPMVAEEITLDAYTQVWREAARFDRGRASALGWLLMITRSRAVDYVRSKAGRARQQEQEWDPVTHDSGDDAENPLEALETATTAETVRGAVAGLDEKKREAIELAFFGGLTHAEISDRLGAPLGTVKTRIRSALTELRTAIEGGSA